VDYNGSAYSFDYLKREEAGEVPCSSLALEAPLATGKVALRPLTEVTDIRRERSGGYVVSTRETARGTKRSAATSSVVSSGISVYSVPTSCCTRP